MDSKSEKVETDTKEQSRNCYPEDLQSNYGFMFHQFHLTKLLYALFTKLGIPYAVLPNQN